MNILEGLEISEKDFDIMSERLNRAIANGHDSGEALRMLVVALNGDIKQIKNKIKNGGNKMQIVELLNERQGLLKESKELEGTLKLQVIALFHDILMISEKLGIVKCESDSSFISHKVFVETDKTNYISIKKNGKMDKFELVDGNLTINYDDVVRQQHVSAKILIETLLEIRKIMIESFQRENQSLKRKNETLKELKESVCNVLTEKY